MDLKIAARKSRSRSSAFCTYKQYVSAIAKRLSVYSTEIMLMIINSKGLVIRLFKYLQGHYHGYRVEVRELISGGASFRSG